MPSNKAQIVSGLNKNLVIAANYFKEAMFKKIDAVNAPGKIKEHTSVGTVQQKGDQLSIDIVIDISEDAAPMAPAFEWGSGEHATRGNVGKYPIVPKEKGALAFEWQPAFVPWGSKKFIGLGGDGKFLFRAVEHPGVAPRPYILPTIRESRQKITEILGKGFKASILVGVPKVEVISA